MSLKDKIVITERRIINDPRGSFLKIMTGIEPGLPNHTGEIYLTIAKPYESRGGHFHKSAKEWFTLIIGNAILKLEDIVSNERVEIKLDALSPVTVLVPPKIAHCFYNPADKDFFLIAYSDCLYDPADTVSYSFNTP